MFRATLLALVFPAAALADVPKVAVDIAPVHSLVAQVMAGVGEPDLILPPGVSAHGYSMRPSEARAVQNADLIVWIGESLTPWLDRAIDRIAADTPQLELGEVDGALVLETREEAVFEHHDDHDEEHAHEDEHHDGHDKEGHDEHGHDEHGHDDHGEEDHDEHAEEGHDEHGDEDHAEHGHDDHHHHGAFDPHMWMHPVNAAAWLDAIAEELAALDPENAATYRANAEAAKSDLAATVADLKTQLEPVKSKGYVVFHDAYQYFETGFEFPAVAALAISDASRPGPRRVEAIQDAMKDNNVVCAFAEPQFDPSVLNALVEGTDVRTGELDPMGTAHPAGPELYGLFITDMVTNLVDCLDD